MQPEVRTIPIEYTVCGHGLRHDPAKKFGEEIMSLLGRVWPAIKTSAVPHDGINRVVYDRETGETEGCTVFAGVVLGDGTGAIACPPGLQSRTVRLTRY